MKKGTSAPARHAEGKSALCLRPAVLSSEAANGEHLVWYTNRLKFILIKPMCKPVGIAS